MNHTSNYHRLSSGVRLLTAVASMAIGVTTALAQNYTVTDLGFLPGKTESSPAAINDAGQVAGVSSTDSSKEAAFRYNLSNKGPMEELAKNVGVSLSRGFGINKSGQVVGDAAIFVSATSKPVWQAALFGKDSVANLGGLKPNGTFSRANSINGYGHIVGFAGPARDSQDSRAFIWTPSGGMQDLGTLGGPYAQAFSINDAGFITGNSRIDKGDAVHAFVTQVSSASPAVVKMRDLGTLGGNSSYGMFINSRNNVVGYSTVSKTDTNVHAFFHNGTKIYDLGSLAGSTAGKDVDQSVALGINSSDDVVGYSYLPGQPTFGPIDPPVSAPQQVAFIYRRGVMANLNTLIRDAADKYLLTSAVAINDKGQIAADAFSYATGKFHAVVLTPVTSALSSATALSSNN